MPLRPMKKNVFHCEWKKNRVGKSYIHVCYFSFLRLNYVTDPEKKVLCASIGVLSARTRTGRKIRAIAKIKMEVTDAHRSSHPASLLLLLPSLSSLYSSLSPLSSPHSSFSGDFSLSVSIFLSFIPHFCPLFLSQPLFPFSSLPSFIPHFYPLFVMSPLSLSTSPYLSSPSSSPIFYPQPLFPLRALPSFSPHLSSPSSSSLPSPPKVREAVTPFN